MNTNAIDVKLEQEAWAYASRMKPDVPAPETVLPLIQPMSFRRTKMGGFALEPVTKTEFEVINVRNTFLLGQKRLNIVTPDPVTFHLLQQQGRTLTSDLPIEVYQQFISFWKMTGRVLVSGLGMGMAASMIANLDGVTQVTVVEKSKTLINFIWKQTIENALTRHFAFHSNRKLPLMQVVHADIFRYLKSMKPNSIDSAYHDIWYGTGEATWHEEVVPLYRLSRQKGINTLGAWGEYEMQAQFRPALYKTAMMNLDHPWEPYSKFMQGLRRTLGAPPYKPVEVEQLIELYITAVGTPEWEALYV